ncbi:MAG TPA: helix-turn-helix domain-containing protein [Verrucomicrobiae bacterium]
MNEAFLLDTTSRDMEPPLDRYLKEHLTALATNMRRRRIDRSLTQEALAYRSGLQRTYISDVERAARNISFVTLLRLAEALGTTVSDLTAAAGMTQPPTPQKNPFVSPRNESGRAMAKIRSTAMWRRVAEAISVETCILDKG